MASTFTEQAVRQCVVCGGTAGIGDTSHGAWMLVFHYAPPHGNHACGHWIHENCRYRDAAPSCPCGSGPAEEGLTLEAIVALRPAVSNADRDESVPTRAELAAVATQDSLDTSDEADDDADDAEGDEADRADSEDDGD